MKTLRSVLAAFLWAGLALRAATLEFVGYMQTSGEPRFVLTDRESNVTSSWLKPGQTFRGFTIRSFDAQRESLSLSNGDTMLTLPLKPSKIENRDAELTRLLQGEEAQLAAGKGDEESVLLSRVLLHSFRRDTSTDAREKTRQQEAIVAAQARRETLVTNRRSVGVATDLDVLERTKDLLREKVLLNTLRQNTPPRSQPPTPTGAPRP